MSTILDALKKSEQERRLNEIPTLSDMPAPNEQSRWPIFLFVTVLVVLIVMLGIVVSKVWFSAPQSLVESRAKEAPVDNSNSPVGLVDNNKAELGQPELANSLVVNVVSYSEDAAKRFIMIDGHLLREGEFVKAGVKIEEIRPNEVVFNSRGEKIVRRP